MACPSVYNKISGQAHWYALTMPHPITLCATENVGEGCGRDFPRKTKSGLCVACEAINRAEGEDKAKKEVISSPLSHGLNFLLTDLIALGCLSYLRRYLAEASIP